MTEAFLQQLACEGLHITPEDVHGLTIRTATVIDLAQTEMQLDLEGEVPEGGDEGSSALTVLEGAVVIAHHKEMGAQIGGSARQALWIIEGLRQRFGFTKAGKDA